MSNERIEIKLDPIKDGIVGNPGNIRDTAGKYVVIGTNMAHRVITEDEYLDYLNAMEKVVLLIASYIIVLDVSKIITIEGKDYFVGSFILSAQSMKVGQYRCLTEQDIEKIKDTLSDHMADILIEGERCPALVIARRYQ